MSEISVEEKIYTTVCTIREITLMTEDWDNLSLEVMQKAAFILDDATIKAKGLRQALHDLLKEVQATACEELCLVPQALVEDGYRLGKNLFGGAKPDFNGRQTFWEWFDTMDKQKS
ncbi:MAG: hypothetical protein ACM3KR_11225 [Deltaproteobacteria bacterium]